MKTLWHVEIDEDDWKYDNFVAAVVWADSAEQAEAIVRSAPRRGPLSGTSDDTPDEPWIENPEWRLHVRPAPTEGIALAHWHAG